MKYILMLVLLSGCGHTFDLNTDKVIVTSVERVDRFGKKYEIITNADLALRTDTLYSVGDTIYLTRIKK